MIKNLIFDFGKVLVDYDFLHTIRHLFASEEDLREFSALFTNAEFIDRCDLEETPFLDIIREAQDEYPRYRTQLQAFHDHYAQFVTGEIPGMRDLLLRLRAEGFRLYGLTNWCSKVHEVMKTWDILTLLDDRIISSEEHLLKPDVAIYLRLCQKFGLHPEECLFTDDKPVNVEGARKAGMKGIVFGDSAQYEQELRQKLAESTDQ